MSFSLYLGPYQPFLENELWEAFKAFRKKEPLAPLVILVPNYLLVGHLRKTLAEKEEKVFNLQIHTLHHFLEGFLEEKVVQEGWKGLPEVLIPWVLKEIAKPLLSKGSAFLPVLETPGIFHALRSTLNELREGLFSPEALHQAGKGWQKKASTKRLGQKTEELSALLSAYQKWKEKGKWLDSEDHYEKALEIPPADQGPVWIYGFYDASLIQRKVLQHLSQKGNSHWFIPYEEHPGFAHAKPFVQWAKGLGPVQKEESWKSNGGDPLQVLQGNLFQERNRREDSKEEVSPSGAGEFELSNCKIWLCPGESREATEVVQGLFTETQRLGSFFSDCAVLLRDPAPYRKILPPAFKDQGIPLSQTIADPLLETMEAKALLLLVECFLKDFPRETLMNFLSCPNLDSAGFKVAARDWNPSHWDVLSREARIVEGEGEWRSRLAAWKASKLRGDKEADEPSPLNRDLQSVGHFERVLAHLFEARGDFAKPRSYPEKTAALMKWFKRFCVEGEALTGVLEVLESFEILSRSFTLSLTPEDFRSLLAALLGERTLKGKTLQEGGVRVLDQMQARGVPFDVIALPGLVGKSVPRLVRQDPLLLDHEREQLNAKILGAEMILKQTGVLEERLLFILALRSARKAILLSAPHLNPSNGSPRNPSIFLFDAVESILGRHIQRLGEVPGLVKVVLVNDWVKKDLAQCVDPLEVLLSCAQMGRLGDPNPALAVMGDKPFFFEGCHLLKFRQALRVFTAYDGILESAQAKQSLALNHSLKNKELSASRLETFAACPLRYFYKYVLNLTVIPEPEKVLELQASDRGNLMHDILEETLKGGVEEGWVQSRDLPKARAGLQVHIERSFRRFEKEEVIGAPALWAWEKRQMALDLERVLTLLLREKDWSPIGFEIAFGGGKPDASKEVALTLGDGTPFRLQGRMDRVDLSADGRRVRVVDYKSGSSSGVSKNKVKGGTKLQLPIYLLALERLYPEKEATEALYDFITRKGGYRPVTFIPQAPDQIEKLLSRVLSTLEASVEGGLFPAAGKECKYCDYRRLCGTGMEARGKMKRDDPKTGAYFQLEGLDDI